jgi:hypothetical protein
MCFVRGREMMIVENRTFVLMALAVLIAFEVIATVFSLFGIGPQTGMSVAPSAYGYLSSEAYTPAAGAHVADAQVVALH